LQTSEQAPASPAGDSRSIESRIGDWLSTPSDGTRTPKQAPQPQQQPDQVPEQQDATSDQGETEVSTESTAPAFEEVEWEGKTYQVPPELKEAVIRQSDYTKKTQDLASQRQLLEHQQAQQRLAGLQQEFEKSVATERQQIGMLDYLIEQRSKANWAQMNTDELVRARLELDQFKEQKSAIEAEIGKKQQQHSAKLQESLAAAREQANALLKQRIPQWSEATAKETRDWALANGFTNEEVASIYDPRHAEVLWKASQYDKTRASAQPAVAQARAAKVSSANPMPKDVRAKLDFRNAVKRTEGKPLERKAAVAQRIESIFGKK
jgi:hypothetical protein